MRPIPNTPNEWLIEIAAAYQDAYETLPFMPLADVEPNEAKLFHLAPHVAIKFRGLPRSRTKAAVEAALSSYVPTKTGPRCLSMIHAYRSRFATSQAILASVS